MPANAGIVVYGVGLLAVVLLGGQHQAALHSSDRNRCVNTEPDLFQPLAAHLNPGHHLVVILTGADFNLLVLRFVWSRARSWLIIAFSRNNILVRLLRSAGLGC